jgi:hypothetical protein
VEIMPERAARRASQLRTVYSRGSRFALTNDQRTPPAALLVADALVTSLACGAGGLVILPADSAYYGRDVIAAARRHRARFSITARKDRAVAAAIAADPAQAWTTIRYPKAVFGEQLQQWISDAEVAETPFTAFASRPVRKDSGLPRG